MEISSKLSIRSRNYKYLDALAKTLYPDNLETPEYMEIVEEIRSINDNYEYVIKITIKSMKNHVKAFDSMRNTIDEILAIISSIEKTRIF